ncbi:MULTISPECIES: YhfC family intramembrane metalloprotease [Clostridium]|uniref:YhfC family intramembrane metalloprotease n=1 Tax=Clostridium TaxID=1485 RepID=UPI00082505E9|nr:MULTISPECIES: YhfC family intramembrane metalloprotease [Clostridium]PJI08718.1 YhfC family intramembrane metalloprotease [Clostridium sp. CT7]
MVKSTTITFMVLAAVICAVFPIALIVYFRKKEKISLKPVFIGMAVFIVFTQILEKTLHSIVIGGNLITNPILFSVYGALAAGVFEETGRFIAFKTVLKDKHEWKDGLAYGIGHGGIEAIFIGALTSIEYIIYSNLINSGKFDALLKSKIPASQIAQLKQVKQSLIQMTPSATVITILERIFAFGIQLGLTMVVLYAIRNRKNIYLFLAILLHALVDFPAVLYQTKIIKSIYVVEGIIALEFILAIVFVVKTKKIFKKEDIINSDL